MKNIHVLPTDKPSRLYFNTKAKYYAFSYTVTSQGGSVSNRHIYITSDEEIKEGDWCIDDEGIVKCTAHAGAMNHYYTKIILTTDQDLIKDGVQAIDDEFLEWFVNNPTCEKVEIYKYKGLNLKKMGIPYKIIIPKEEPKQRLEKYSERFDNKDNELVEGIFNPENWGKRIIEEPEQETLEEAAEKYNSQFIGQNEFAIEDFKNGAKWQAERMYSEEEVGELVYNIIGEYGKHYGIMIDGAKLNELFEQFKKK